MKIWAIKPGMTLHVHESHSAYRDINGTTQYFRIYGAGENGAVVTVLTADEADALILALAEARFGWDALQQVTDRINAAMKDKQP